jgi:hypothetical protein
LHFPRNRLNRTFVIAKNVIHQTDLPAPAQKKLMARKGLRTRIHGALNLLGTDDRIL